MNGNLLFARAGKAGIVCAFIFLAGCHEMTGGGWIPGANGGKANFGFTAKCVADPNLGDVAFWDGQLQFQDRLAGVRFHAHMDPLVGLIAPGIETCEQAGDSGEGSEIIIDAFCESKPGGVPGRVVITLRNLDGSGDPAAGPQVEVQTPHPFIPSDACTDNGLPYYNAGNLGGGALKSHGH